MNFIIILNEEMNKVLTFENIEADVIAKYPTVLL